jgi:hypothetical protein
MIGERLEKRNADKPLVRKFEGNRPLGRTRCRLNNNINIDLKEIGFEGVDWIHTAQDVGR